MEVTIEPATSFSVPRIAQLTQKTNQMNLTTRRYAEANIQSFINDLNSRIFSVSAKDRFGDYGIIGVIILKLQGKECLIDTFLLSCRVISRNIENVMIAFITESIKRIGSSILIGEYIPTARNKPAADMYENFKFEKTGETFSQLNINKQKLYYPAYIKKNLHFEFKKQ